MNIKISQSIEVDLEAALVTAVKTMSEENFAILISSVMKRAPSPHVNKEFMIEKMKLIHSIG